MLRADIPVASRTVNEEVRQMTKQMPEDEIYEDVDCALLVPDICREYSEGGRILSDSLPLMWS